MARIRVSGVQMPVSLKLSDNLSKILRYIETNDSDYILFPEMSLTGHHGDFSQKAVENACRQIAAACRQFYVTAIIGTGFQNGEGTFIQTRILSDEGNLLGTHEKLVPTLSDRKFCRPGEELRVFTHTDLTFGCLIGNDLWVAPGMGPYPDPRLSYQLGKRGARLVFHAIQSGSANEYAEYYESNVTLRARESSTFIVTANTAMPNASVNAVSGIMSPEGTWLVKCPRKGEHRYAYDLELELP